jgi:hypothetical protein
MPGAYLCRNVLPLGEPDGVLRRLIAPVLAGVAVLAALVGAHGFASLVLLAVIAACAWGLLEAVGAAVDGRGDRLSVVTAAAGLVLVILASAAHVPLIALGLLACLGVDLLAEPELDAELVEPSEIADKPASRAA